jgi:hypothetical protein
MDRGSTREERAARPRHRRPRLEDRCNGRSDDDGRDDLDVDDDWRGVEREEEERQSSRRRGQRDDDSKGATQRSGRKRRRGGGGDNRRDDDSGRDGAHERPASSNRHGEPYENDDVNSRSGHVMDWSSRHGRRQMPSLAYDVGQQKRFLGFLDRRDASGGHAGAAGMTFDIGPDGLVQMPPPNTLVRHSSHSRHGADTRSAPPNYRETTTTAAAAAGRKKGDKDHLNGISDENDNDDSGSVASHESLFNDPATAHLGILPDILPPSNLYRVALYGVDLSITAGHLSSMVTQLLGKAAKPYRVRRPAREMLLAAIAYTNDSSSKNVAATPAVAGSVQKVPLTSKAEVKSLAPASSGGAQPNFREEPNAAISVNPHSHESGVLSDETHVSAPQREFAGVLNSPSSSGILPDAPAVLEPEGEAPGVLGSGSGSGSAGAGEVEREEENDNDEGVLPDAASLPLPPPPTAPAFYLPGLHDVNGPGGMVVLEFAEHEHAVRTAQVLNGGYVNGRRIAASM